MLKMSLPPVVTRRHLLLAAAFLSLLALLALAWVMRPDTLERRAGRIRPGMSRAEVESALRAAPDHRHPGQGLQLTALGPDLADCPGCDTWSLDDGLVSVRFDQGRATDDVVVVRVGDDATPWGRLHRWLGWWPGA